jgi:cation transporter-like permease
MSESKAESIGISEDSGGERWIEGSSTFLDKHALSNGDDRNHDDDDDDDDEDNWSKQVETDDIIQRISSSVTGGETHTIDDEDDGPRTRTASGSAKHDDQPSLVPPRREEPTMKEKLVERERQRRVESERARWKRQFAMAAHAESDQDEDENNNNINMNNYNDSSGAIIFGDTPISPGGAIITDHSFVNDQNGINSMVQAGTSVTGTSVAGTVGEDTVAPVETLDDDIVSYPMERFLQDQQQPTMGGGDDGNNKSSLGKNETNQDFVMERFLQEPPTVTTGGGGSSIISSPSKDHRNNTGDNIPSDLPSNNNTTNNDGDLPIEIESSAGHNNSNNIDLQSPSHEPRVVFGLTEAEIKEMAAIDDASRSNAPPSERDDMSELGELVSDFGGLTPHVLDNQNMSQGTPVTVILSISSSGHGGGIDGHSISSNIDHVASSGAGGDGSLAGNPPSDIVRDDDDDDDEEDDDRGIMSLHSQVPIETLPTSAGAGMAPGRAAPALAPENEIHAAAQNPQLGIEALSALAAQLDSAVTTLLGSTGPHAPEVKLQMLPQEHQIRQLLLAVNQILPNLNAGNTSADFENEMKMDEGNENIINRTMRPGMFNYKQSKPRNDDMDNLPDTNSPDQIANNNEHDHIDGFDFDKNEPSSPLSPSIVHDQKGTTTRTELWSPGFSPDGDRTAKDIIVSDAFLPAFEDYGSTDHDVEIQRFGVGRTGKKNSIAANDSSAKVCKNGNIEDGEHRPLLEGIPPAVSVRDQRRASSWNSLQSARNLGDLESLADSVFSDIRSQSAATLMSISNDADKYLGSSMFERAFPERMLALAVTLIFELPTLFLISGGSDQLCDLIGHRRYLILISLLPITSAISGNVGLQASTLTTRAISHHQVRKDNFKFWLLKEMGAALYIGVGMGLVVGTMAFVMGHQSFAFGLTIFFAQFIGILTAGFTGTLAPLLFTFIFERDSGKWGGPLETAVQDVVGSFAMIVISYRIMTFFGPYDIDASDMCVATVD